MVLHQERSNWAVAYSCVEDVTFSLPYSKMVGSCEQHLT